MLRVVLLVPLLASGCFLFKPAAPTTAPSGESTGVAPSGDPQADAGGQGPSEDTASAPAAAPAGPVSVTLRNSCKQTVKVFFGEKPKFGSGRYSTMSSNSSTSSSFRAGDMFWIVDQSDNGVASVTVAQGMREIEIVDGCVALRTR